MKSNIVIRNSSGWVSVPADPALILGFECAVHRSIDKAGWSVSIVSRGIAFVTGWKTREGAIRETERRILNKGTETVKASIESYPEAPASAPAFVPRKKAPAADIDTVVRLVGDKAGLTDKERAAVRKALNGRTGQLKAKAPSAFGHDDERLACAAWNGIQPNGFKIGTFSVLSLSRYPECAELFRKLSAIKWPDAFDSDKKALVDAGVW